MNIKINSIWDYFELNKTLGEGGIFVLEVKMSGTDKLEQKALEG